MHLEEDVSNFLIFWSNFTDETRERKNDDLPHCPFVQIDVKGMPHCYRGPNFVQKPMKIKGPFFEVFIQNMNIYVLGSYTIASPSIYCFNLVVREQSKVGYFCKIKAHIINPAVFIQYSTIWKNHFSVSCSDLQLESR